MSKEHNLINGRRLADSQQKAHQENQPGVVKNGYLTSKEAANYLNISERHLFNLRSRGVVRYFQVNRLVRFKKEDLDAYLNKYAMELIPNGKEVTNG